MAVLYLCSIVYVKTSGNILKNIILFGFFIFGMVSANAVEERPVVRRVCQNNDDSTVTLFWNIPKDACGGFVNYKIYGSDLGGPFNLILTIPVYSTSTVSFKVPNTNPTRKYYISVTRNCPLNDTISSPIIDTDFTLPNPTNLDSLSVDLSTQKVVAGWQKNPDSDVKAYRLYRYKNSVNDSIAQTSSTFDFPKTLSAVNPEFVSIAVIDSCHNSSAISGVHQTALLTGNIDTCKNSIALQWLDYIGWGGVGNYIIMIQKNKGNFIPYKSFGTPTSTNFSDFELGDQLCFYIRSVHPTNPSITSSSNKICFQTRKLVLPNETYLSLVSVPDMDKQIQLKWVSGSHSDLDSFYIYSTTSQGAKTVIDKLKHVPGKSYYSNIFYSLSPSEKVYSFHVESTDKCRNRFNISNISTNILLKNSGIIDDYEITWNNYIGWKGNVMKYEIYREDIVGGSSTWNMIGISTGQNFTDISLKPESQDQFCYFVRAIEENNLSFPNEISISNKVCINQPFTAFFPDAINPDSDNNKFSIVGRSIDYSKSHFEIFNRWGQKVFFTQDVKTGWDGKIEGQNPMMGVYVFTAVVWGLNGERKDFKGTIRIIR